MKTKEKGILSESDVFFVTPSNQSLKLFHYVTSTGHFYYEDTYNLSRETFNSYLLMYIVKGSARIFYNDFSSIVKAGDIVFMNCYNPHGYESLGDLETIWFHFDGNNTKWIFEELYSLYDGSIVVSNSKEVIIRINKIYKNHKDKKRISEPVQSAYIARILAEFFTNSNQVEDVKPSVIDEIVSYMDENYAKKLTLKELAKRAGLSEFYFSRLFKKETGYTIHEYLVKTRVTSAKSMLKARRMSLKEIAYECGFSNESSFSVTFKKHTGMTPGTFRKMKV